MRSKLLNNITFFCIYTGKMRRMGADHFLATSDPMTFEKLKGGFDMIINTVSVELDMNSYLNRYDGNSRPSRKRAVLWRVFPN